MKKFLAIMLALTFIFTLCACNKTTDNGDETTNGDDKVQVSDKDYIVGKGEMIIGITYFEPMNYIDDNGDLAGFETEFAKAVCEELGVTAKFQEISWTAKETELASKNIDCIWNGMTATAEREEAMSVSQHYMKNKQVLVMKADKAADVKNADGLTIVAEKESAGEEVATSDEFFAKANYIAVDTQSKALTEVKSGTADGCVVDYVCSIGMIGEGTDYADLVVVETEAFNEEEYGIAFRKGSDITAEVNKAIDTLINNGKLAEIARKYKLEEQIIVK
ncbi:MAG: transporter substrate-binding domain-containing protein [Clostridia bacterium]|nr:transporter substrate-binding domain-containing protein [Clostridia bacterium]MBR6650527.1 transporter substrate-binding domain-containing protein [Clostridia bacterium]